MNNFSININMLQDPKILKEYSLKEGMSILGKIVSLDKGDAELMLLNGETIKATIAKDVDLPISTPIQFEVVEAKEDSIILRPKLIDPAITDAEGNNEPISKERVTHGIVSALNINDTPQNIKLLNNLKPCSIAENIYKMLNVLSSDEHTDSNISDIKDSFFISKDKLEEYIKEFNNAQVDNEVGMTKELGIKGKQLKYGMEKLVGDIDKLLSNIKKSNIPKEEYAHISTELLKELSIQRSHPFPLFFIPIPLFFNNHFYPSEICIEKDGENEDGEGNTFIYLFINTNHLENIEVDIASTPHGLDINLYCKKRFIDLFKDNMDELKLKLNTTPSINLNSFNVLELKKERTVQDLFKKYIKPYPSLDTLA
jgi:hypothetical protein